MKLSHRIVLSAAAGLAVLATAAPAVMAGPQAVKAPVVVRNDKTFGRVLFTPRHNALYYWDVEKKAGRIVCTASCLKQWPPLIVRSRAAVPKKIAGIKGSFGVVKRPNGRLQVTYTGRAIYTYFDDGPNQVLCNNFNSWFVVRV